VGEQGTLGVAAMNSTVYIYLSESTMDGGSAVGRRVYRYDWTGSELINPILVKDMNSIQTYHNGGGMVVGREGLRPSFLQSLLRLPARPSTRSVAEGGYHRKIP
jgi:hypothetical protein